MSKLPNRSMALVLAASGAFAFSVAAQDGGAPASPFDNPQNLQALPTDISPDELRETMRGFSFATGLRCNECHVRTEQGMNFALDDKREKRVARQMITMVQSINGRIDGMSDLQRASTPAVAVECMTCHRGVQKPEQIRAILERYREEGDAEGAVARYTELRDEFYGAHAYDFSAFTLGQYAVDVTDTEDPDFALSLHRLNASLNADVATTHRTYGDTLMALRRFDEAVAAYERAVELAPSSSFLRTMRDRAIQAREN